jgi:hypothetical protein
MAIGLLKACTTNRRGRESANTAARVATPFRSPYLWRRGTIVGAITEHGILSLARLDADRLM